MTKIEEEKMGEFEPTFEPEIEFSKNDQSRIVAEALKNLGDPEKKLAIDFKELKALIKGGIKNLGEISSDSPEELRKSYEELNSIRKAIDKENRSVEENEVLIENLKNLQSGLHGLFKPKEVK